MPDASLSVDVPNARGPDRRGWHIDKTISVSDLVAVIMLGVPAFLWASAIESRLAVMSEKVATMERQRVEDMAATNGKLSDLQTQIRSMDGRISDRLDKIADKIGASR